MNTEKLKIAYITGDCATLGTYFRWHNIAMGLVNMGHTVTVFCVDNNNVPVARQENRDGVIYKIAESSKGKSLFGTINHPVTSLKRIFTDFEECDIVHVFQPFLSVYLPWKFNFRKKARISFFDWDDLWVDAERDKEKKNFKSAWDYKLKGYFERKIPSVSEHMTVCSKLLKTLAIERGAKQVDVIPNGFWEYDVPEKSAAREKLGLQKDAVYVGFMGRTGFELHWAFKAFETCLKQGMNIRFALCGPTIDIMDGLTEEVRSHLDYLGSLSPADTRYFAAAIDLGLLPLMKTEFNESRFPIKFAEYLAANLPVLCSEVGEVNEYGKKYPWVIKAGISESDWIKHFIETVQLLIDGKLVPVNRDVVLNDLSWEGISKQVEKVYLEAAKK
ncbi:glycosyltransferase [Mucilaginibacter sp. AW1-3]